MGGTMWRWVGTLTDRGHSSYRFVTNRWASFASPALESTHHAYVINFISPCTYQTVGNIDAPLFASLFASHLSVLSLASVSSLCMDVKPLLGRFFPFYKVCVIAFQK